MFRKQIQLLILIFNLGFGLIPSLSVWADPQVCETIQVDRRRIMCRQQYDVNQLKRDELRWKKQGFSEKKARGILGEDYARDAIESQTTYVSLFTHFQDMGCQVQESLRDGADRGLDDIFVVLSKSGRIDRRMKPLFLEAKYSSSCMLTLSNTNTLCQQLSVQWLSHHVKGTKKRVIDGAQICYGNQNQVTVHPCTLCYRDFLSEIEWVGKMLHEQRFDRAASLLCPNGSLKVYNVVNAD